MRVSVMCVSVCVFMSVNFSCVCLYMCVHTHTYIYTMRLQWPLVDPFTSTVPTHDYLIGLASSVEMTNSISLWDLTFPFKYVLALIVNSI